VELVVQLELFIEFKLVEILEFIEQLKLIIELASLPWLSLFFERKYFKRFHSHSVRRIYRRAALRSPSQISEGYDM
jgi:hypothetical protein